MSKCNICSREMITKEVCGCGNVQELKHSIDNLSLMSARYAHHRQTGASLAVVRELMINWDMISKDAQFKILQESYEATYNISDWEDLREWRNNETK